MRTKGEMKYNVVEYEDMNNNFTLISNDIYELTNGNEFKIYCFLCSNYDEKDYATPSLSYIAKETNISRATVVKCIKELEKKGLVGIGRINNYSNNIYKIFVPIIEEEDNNN